jgi:hypothetical protein
MTKTPIKPALYGFLIDPQAQQISRIEMPADSRGNLDTMYQVIGCELVEVAYINDQRDGVFVDEEGLLKPQQYFFFIEGGHQPLAGRGVVLGCDEEGETVAPTVTLDWLRAHTAFVHRLGHGLTAISSPAEMQQKVAGFFP